MQNIKYSDLEKYFISLKELEKKLGSDSCFDKVYSQSLKLIDNLGYRTPSSIWNKSLRIDYTHEKEKGTLKLISHKDLGFNQLSISNYNSEGIFEKEFFLEKRRNFISIYFWESFLKGDINISKLNKIDRDICIYE